eukprot:2138915-Prymnesium_polylepis.1
MEARSGQTRQQMGHTSGERQRCACSDGGDIVGKAEAAITGGELGAEKGEVYAVVVVAGWVGSTLSRARVISAMAAST